MKFLKRFMVCIMRQDRQTVRRPVDQTSSSFNRHSTAQRMLPWSRSEAT